jgi:hypothetical protein
MKSLKTTAVISLSILCIAAACSSSEKQNTEETKKYVPVSKELYDTIAHMDSVLFDAFNNRDLEVVKTIFSTDVEFYHDKGGLSNYDQTIESSKRLFDQNNGLRRTLIPGSLEVYPIKDYGAIQIGVHKFCHKENGKDDCGVFKFLHVWQRTAAGWKLARVISYDH